MVCGAAAAGGSASLADLLDKYGEAIESDLRRFYGVDIRDLFTSVLSPRHVVSLIVWLPDDSALAAAAQGGREHLGWGTDRYMRAAQWNLTAAAAMAGSKRQPPTFPTPGKKAKGVPLSGLAPKRKPPTRKG